MSKQQIKLTLEFSCTSIKQAEEFAAEAFHTFLDDESYPRMIRSLVHEDGKEAFDPISMTENNNED